MDDASIGSFIQFSNPDTDYVLAANALTQEDISTMEGEDASLSVQEYFDKYYKASDEDIKKYDLEQSDVKVAGTDGIYIKRKIDGGYAYASASWIQDDTIYGLHLTNSKGFNDDGSPKDGIEPMGDDLVGMFDGVVASVQAGDGDSFLKQSLSADSVGSVSFEVPKGFEFVDVGTDRIELQKGDAILRFDRTTEESLAEWNWEDAPSSLQEYYTQISEGMDPASIAGIDGFMAKYPDEDGNFYSINGGFLADDGFYSVSIDTNAYDENGLKADAVPLTEEDMAAFDSFVASLTVK